MGKDASQNITMQQHNSACREDGGFRDSQWGRGRETPVTHHVGELGKAGRQVGETYVFSRSVPEAIRYAHRLTAIPGKMGPGWGRQCGLLNDSSFVLMPEMMPIRSAVMTASI